MAQRGAKAFARVVNGFAGFERCEFCFLAGTVFEGVYIEGENLFFTGAFYFFVEALAVLSPSILRLNISSTSGGTL